MRVGSHIFITLFPPFEPLMFLPFFDGTRELTQHMKISHVPTGRGQNGDLGDHFATRSHLDVKWRSKLQYFCIYELQCFYLMIRKYVSDVSGAYLKGCLFCRGYTPEVL